MTARTMPHRGEQRLTIGVISHLPLMTGLSAVDLTGLARRSWNVRARRGEIFVRRKAGLPGIYAVAYGTIKLVLRGAEGEERILRLASAGETFGEPSALLGRAPDFEACAVAEATLVVIPAAALLELAARNPHFAHELTLAVSRRAVQALAELHAATLQRSDERLASYLTSLAGVTRTSGPTRVQLPASKTTIAARIGVKNETLSRLLRRFAAQGLIQVARGEISILEPELLAARGRGAARMPGL